MSENGKILKARFVIPKDKIKNANTPMNYMVSYLKTSWIRNYSEKVWIQAMNEQNNINVVEPDELDVKKEILSEEYMDYFEKIRDVEEELIKVTEEINLHKMADQEYKDLKKERSSLKRKKMLDDPRFTEVDDKIHEYELKTEYLKATKERRKGVLKRIKENGAKDAKKAVTKVSINNRKNYINARIKANEFQRLFKECHVSIKVYNITNRDFDSPNFAPTSKAIMDGGTDASALWEDDNNNVILSTTFLAGGNLEKSNYVFDVSIYENIQDFANDMKNSN